LWVTLGLNLAVAGGKLFVGWHNHLLSLTADGTHSMLDGINNIVGLVALGAAARPPDEGHPYGHRRFETFAALGIGILLATVAIGVVREAIARTHGAAAPESGIVPFAVMGATIVINIFVARYESRAGKRLGSAFLVADAQHTLSDVFVSLAVIGALIGVALHQPIVDLIAAIVVALVIGRAAWRVLKDAFDVLSDSAALNTDELCALVNSVDGVRSCHKIRTRSSGGHVFVDLHIQVDPQITVAAGHHIAHEVVAAVKAKHPSVVDVLVHTEPSR
jgi:cation diffusion facilitator family transporter